MKKIIISDATLCREGSLSFKEKIEIARQLDLLGADIIEFPAVSEHKSDALLIRTVSSIAKKSILSVAAGADMKSIERAADALSSVQRARIRIELPVSAVRLDYSCHKKPDKMLELIKSALSAAKEKCADVEFCALDATRAEKDFLLAAVSAAESAGACEITLCDNAAEMLPDAFAEFVNEIGSAFSLPLGVYCSDKNSFATAAAALSVKGQASCVKTSVGGDCVSLEAFASMIKNCGVSYGISSGIKYTNLHRIVKQINWVSDNSKNDKSPISVSSSTDDSGIRLDISDSREEVASAVKKLGYDLSEDDCGRVYAEFLNVAAKKNVGARELESIVSNVALQVPETYQLKSYVINNGNDIPSSAQITLLKGERQMRGICVGDGPIDAAFITLSEIIGQNYELDDFQLRSVTEGTEAMGAALVKLRYNGSLYSGNGISTDIICASIRAYINAVNKIVYEEENR